VEWPWKNSPEAADSIQPKAVLDYVAGTINDTLHQCYADGIQLSTEIMLCMATYVRGGKLLGNGIYAKIMHLGDDARELIANAVKAPSSKAVHIYVIHDGTAAGTLHAGEQDTAVLVIGTAIGVGFPSSTASGLRNYLGG
jgi:hypothetical protein